MRTLLVCLLSGPLLAQAVLHVGAGGFAQISTAIAAASPGDVIEVAAGTYAPFTLDKALTITALPSPPGQIVQIVNPSVLTPAVAVLRPPAGTRAFVTNVHFRNMWWNYFQLETRVDRGTVCFEECTFEGANDSTASGLSVQTADVQLRRCLLVGGMGSILTGGGLTVVNGSVFGADCFIRGGDLGIKNSTPGGNGVVATNSLLHLVRTDVVAGSSNGFACFVAGGGQGVWLQGTSTAWLADCTVTGGAGTCAAGGDALRNQSATPVQLARTVLTPGTGTPPGQASVGPTAAAPLLGLTGGTVGLVRGQTWSVDYRTEPFWPIVVLLSTDVVVQTSPVVAERLLLPLPNSMSFTGLVADTTGAATLQTTVPALPILLHQRAFLQAFSGIAAPVRTQPALGGVIR